MRANHLLVATTMPAAALAALLVAMASQATAQSFGGQKVGGQSALQTVEDKLGGAAGASDTTPGSGYLGGEFDDPKAGQKGVLVINVRPRGPAEAGGLKPNDLITSIDGLPVSGLTDLDGVLDKATVNQRLRMTINRNGRMENLIVTLGTRPPPPSPAELNPGEPTTPPATLPAPGSFPAPATAPATGTPPASGLPRSPTLGSAAPALGSPAVGSPAVGSPALGSPAERPAAERPATDRPATGGSFSPSTATPSTDSSSRSAVTPAVPAEPSGGIRAQPLGEAPSRARGGLTDVPPVAPAEPTPGTTDSARSSAMSGSGGSGGPTLGITVDALTDEARQANGLTVRRGALITAVRPGSPADTAGLPIGGLVVRLNNRQISSADDLVTAIRGARPGQEVELGYFEGSEYQRKSVKLGPTSATAAPGSLPRSASGMSGGGMPSGGIPSGAMPAADRPLLGRVERIVDGFARGGVSGPSTVYDPSVVAELQRQVAELNATVKSLDERLRTVEGSRGTAATPGTPAPAFTPGFGTAPPSPATPGFTPGFAPPGSTP